MSFLSPPKLPDPPKPPASESVALSDMREKQAALVAGMAGRKANQFTGPMGVAGPAPVAYKMLFGN